MTLLQTRLEDFVDTEYYQDLVKQVLDLAKTKGATSAEAGLRASQGLSLTVRNQSLENIEFNRDKSIGVTVYKGKKKGSASTSDLSPKALEQTVEAAIHLAQYTQEDPYAGLAEKEDLATKVIDCDLYLPWQVDIEALKQQVLTCEQAAFDEDSKIVNSDGASIGTSQSFRVYGNSFGFLGAIPGTRHGLSCRVIAKDEKGMQRDYFYTSSRNPAQLVSPKKIGQIAAQRTRDRLGCTAIPTQKLPVIFRHDVAASLIGHFCSAISGSALYRKSSFLLDSQGKRIFHPKVLLTENPHLLQGMGSAWFDGDGVATTPRALVQDGIVQGYILSAYSARKLGLKNTGNAGGVRNLHLKPTTAYQDLIGNQSRALLVTELMGQSINMVTGDYSRGAAGFLIEQGKITQPVSEVTIAGNLNQMFEQMSQIGDDVDTRGNTHTGSILVDQMMIAGL